MKDIDYIPKNTTIPSALPKNDAATLYQMMRHQLEYFIRSRVTAPMDVEDLIQDVFIKIHEGIGSVHNDTKVAAWVFALTRNAIIDHYRRRRPHEVLSEEGGSVEPHDAASHQIGTWVADGVRILIELLPEQHRQALLRTEYDGITQIQLAAELGLSVSAAKSRVQRARLKLRELLLEFCHMEFDRYGTMIDCHPVECDFCGGLKKIRKSLRPS